MSLGPRRVAIVAIALVVAIFVAPALGRSDTRVLKGPGFRTAYPAGWHVERKVDHGLTRYELATRGASLDVVGVPSAGGIGVTVALASVKDLQAQLHHRLPRDPVALARAIVGTPAGSSDTRVVTSPRRTRLAGSAAGTLTLSYRYHARDIVQRDVVTRHGKRVYFVELDVDRARGEAGAAALHTVLTRWRWR
jgi:hypothetical protein